MTFHINSNLSPTEAVKMHPELQVHPVIAEWAQAAEDSEKLEKLLEDIEYLFLDEKLNSIKKFKIALAGLCANLK